MKVSEIKDIRSTWARNERISEIKDIRSTWARNERVNQKKFTGLKDKRMQTLPSCTQ